MADRLVTTLKLAATAVVVLGLAFVGVALTSVQAHDGTSDPRLEWAVFASAAALTLLACLYGLRRWWDGLRDGRPPSRRGAGLVTTAGPLGAGVGVVAAHVLPPPVLAALDGASSAVCLVLAGCLLWVGYRVARNRRIDRRARRG